MERTTHVSRNVKRAFAAAAVMAATAGIAACGGDDKAGASGGGASFELTIGDVEAYTGDLGALGEPINKAVELAAKEATAAAKAAGSGITVKVETADTQSDPQAAVSAARKVVDAGASCLTGPITTPESLAILDAVSKVRRIPMMPTATSTKLTGAEDDDTIFRTSPPDSLQARALVLGVEKALKGAEGKSVGIAYQNSPYGEGLADSFAAAWKALGGTIVGPIGYDATQTSFDSEAAKLMDGNPDALVVADYPDTFGKLAAALLRTGRFDAKTLFVSDALAVSPIPKGIPTQALEGAWGTRAGAPTDTPEAKGFDELYKQAAGGARATLDAQSFDAGILCFLAAAAAGSNDSEKIAGALRDVAGPPGKAFSYLELADAVKALEAGEDIDYVGVSGPIDFDAQGDPTAALYDLFRWKKGEIVVQQQLDAKTEAGS
jgi:ABC-type branched-subunit amino acid transport system substrate-binding protein